MVDGPLGGERGAAPRSSSSCVSGTGDAIIELRIPCPDPLELDVADHPVTVFLQALDGH